MKNALKAFSHGLLTSILLLGVTPSVSAQGLDQMHQELMMDMDATIAIKTEEIKDQTDHKTEKSDSKNPVKGDEEKTTETVMGDEKITSESIEPAHSPEVNKDPEPVKNLEKEPTS